ncbi:TraY domain-containing protein, partial [Vibrio crassostreae]|nr:TraY domain-containing protein [Vibrio crassostreae]NOH78077.1 TraY domain-containing protein [Vibrio crassostreae]
MNFKSECMVENKEVGIAFNLS